MRRFSSCAIAAVLALLTALPAGGAQAAEPAVEMGWFERYNRMVFGFNGLVDSAAETVVEWTRPQRTEPKAPRRHQPGGFGNMLSNLVNEPMTVAASLAVADLDTAWIAGRRFAINSTVGFLGWYDRATARGLPAVHADAGLSLCRYGVGEGGYMVLPFIGPRTIRDAVADVVVINVILWSTVAALAGTGASFQTILVAEAVEIAADIVATRQIDPKAKALGTRDYDVTRAQYLEQRRARCADTVAGAAKPAL